MGGQAPPQLLLLRLMLVLVLLAAVAVSSRRPLLQLVAVRLLARAAPLCGKAL